MHATLTAVQLLGVCLIMEPHTVFTAPPSERGSNRNVDASLCFVVLIAT